MLLFYVVLISTPECFVLSSCGFSVLLTTKYIFIVLIRTVIFSSRHIVRSSFPNYKVFIISYSFLRFLFRKQNFCNNIILTSLDIVLLCIFRDIDFVRRIKIVVCPRIKTIDDTKICIKVKRLTDGIKTKPHTRTSTSDYVGICLCCIGDCTYTHTHTIRVSVSKS